MMLGKWCHRRVQCMVYHKLSVCNETQYLWRMITCSTMFEKYACQSIKTSHEKRLTLAFEKDGAAFFSGSTPHSAPCLLCYFPHLRSSLGHETLSFALGTLLKSLLGCGVPQESFNPRESQIWAPISGDWRDNHHKIQVIQRPAQTFSQA